jgi:hypothetical protein
MTDSDEYSSLFQCGINYVRKSCIALAYQQKTQKVKRREKNLEERKKHLCKKKINPVS